ncbi:MAG: threo-3-hydroxy-L-aspartate ammonia-lyase [Phycisphaeraceae bacterium]|nr:MAG: threo-3-hydroxy-L-aspartate ammonia-lyase [Phycisphaeraceae bacterium]
MPDLAVNYEDIAAAAGRIAGIANRTPVMTSRTVNERTGAEVFFKCENFQRAGAFKFRGACNATRRLTPEQRQRGVLTYSSGNHAQALALACKLVETPLTIVMPDDAPAVKVAASRGYGAEVILYDPDQTKREQLGSKLAEERGLSLIPPYDHPHIVAGAGTCAKEFIEEVGPLDLLLVCCGGGGLLSGCAISTKHLAPGCRVIGVEPDGGDDGVRSFKTRELQRVANPQTIADGAKTPSLGRINFPIILEHVDDMVSVSDAQIVSAMRVLWERMKLVVEPTGALATAALLEGVVPAPRGGRIGVVLSGGNVDLARVGELFAGA